MLYFYTAPEAYLLFISKAFSNICAAHILSHFSSILLCRYWYSRNVFTIFYFMTNKFTAKYTYYIQRTTCFISYTTKNENLKLQLVSFILSRKIPKEHFVYPSLIYPNITRNIIKLYFVLTRYTQIATLLVVSFYVICLSIDLYLIYHENMQAYSKQRPIFCCAQHAICTSNQFRKQE